MGALWCGEHRQCSALTCPMAEQSDVNLLGCRVANQPYPLSAVLGGGPYTYQVNGILPSWADQTNPKTRDCTARVLSQLRKCL